jgi:sulfate adenylyltransferase subunit 1 (EFTu-like GTPase family)
MESTQPPYGAAPLPPPAVHVVPLIPPMGANVLPGSNSEPEMDTITLPTTLSEADFAKSLSDANISINIQVPSDPNQASWNLNGQTISITIDVMTKVKAIKQQIQAQLGSMPVNKMQLKNSSVGFLKDNLSLAFLNIGPNNDCLELLPKVRGGRR